MEDFESIEQKEDFFSSPEIATLSAQFFDLKDDEQPDCK